MAIKIKTTQEEISAVKRKLIVEIGADEVRKKFNEAYRSLGKQARIPGFRPGKIPRNILEKRFGRQVAEDVTKDLISESLPVAVEETETFPLSVPVVENDVLKADQDFRYSAVLEVRPRIELNNYKDIEVEKDAASVTDQDVDEQIEQIRKSFGKLKPVEDAGRPVEEDDYVIVEYEGFEEGRPLEGIKSTNFLLRVGSNDFHPDFEKGLIGMKKDEQRQIRVSFPPDHYHAKLAGKDVDFKVTVTEIKTLELPELNDEFAKGLGPEIEDLDHLRGKVREELLKREEKRVDQEMKKSLLRQISDQVDFELPEVLVQAEIDNAVRNVQDNLTRTGSSLEKAGLTEEKLRGDFLQPSRTKVKNRLILGEIARREKLAVDEGELNEGINELAAGIGQNPQVVRKYYQENQLIENLREKLLEEKALNCLVNNAKVKEKRRSEPER